ncbi:RING finger protein 122 isoform X1 [Gymnodraco acuticeps]|uniref:RING finger protein 122 n=1 Tax=Gymnodraco acuticeps TaxID=8218 RepID=A0A6P8VJR8_GYMAC|nr:RING finger protein 122 isoform X1 [Gymnodraco acuticeps]
MLVALKSMDFSVMINNIQADFSQSAAVMKTGGLTASSSCSNVKRFISADGGCFCGLGLVYSNKSCTMPPITFQDLPLNIYMVIFGTGIFVFILSLVFCCYFISKLRHQAQSERFGYREVVLKGDPKKLNLHGQTCAVCLEDFKVKDELGVLPCQHAFHRKCLVKWLEVRCVCPMCNKPIAGPPEQHHSIGTLLDELV